MKETGVMLQQKPQRRMAARVPYSRREAAGSHAREGREGACCRSASSHREICDAVTSRRMSREEAARDQVRQASAREEAE